ncbi:MAG: hypothetical protein ABUL58_06675 [Steroidobacter sp.]
MEVRIWYICLDGVEKHLDRVKACIKQSAHDIYEDDIRKLCNQDRLNLVRLLPLLTELRMYDNRIEDDPYVRKTAKPTLALQMSRGKLTAHKRVTSTSAWAKPIVAAALKNIFNSPRPLRERGWG